ncbi:hypothetical protein [Nostoc sp. PCC 7524]|nr:hypothetical protein [Nostoc sp. PCC 7524]
MYKKHDGDRYSQVMAIFSQKHQYQSFFPGLGASYYLPHKFLKLLSYKQ